MEKKEIIKFTLVQVVEMTECHKGFLLFVRGLYLFVCKKYSEFALNYVSIILFHCCDTIQQIVECMCICFENKNKL